MAKSNNGHYIVFVFDVDKPGGGWNDALKKNGKILKFKNIGDAVSAGGKITAGKKQYQVVDIGTCVLIGCGGYATGRRPTDEKAKKIKAALNNLQEKLTGGNFI